MKTIGLIGGMSWESTIPYYRIINEEVRKRLGGLHSAKIILHSVEFDEIEQCQSNGDWDKSAQILGKAAQGLEAAGVDFILICTNTMHKVQPVISQMIHIPIIHIADTTAYELEKYNIRKVGLLGTKYTMKQEFYKQRLYNHGIEVLIPEEPDASWGSYHVTTLHAYEPVILENALIYSDNIYFAKAALKIGSEEMESSLTGLGFNEELPFEIKVAESQYSNSEGIETEIQLADSGYGQGQVLVNPLHMACIYSAFCNEGNVIKPYLVYKNEIAAEYWIPGAFSNETASRVLEGTKKVVNDSNGTGYAAHRDDILLAGKTGTAEIKASKDDTSGTELGWFAIFTAEDTVERPILIISMVEDVKGRGGSGYVVKKDNLVLEEWFGSN